MFSLMSFLQPFLTVKLIFVTKKCTFQRKLPTWHINNIIVYQNINEREIVWSTVSLIHFQKPFRIFIPVEASCYILFVKKIWRSLKVHFMIHSLIPPFFSKKVEIFIPVEAFSYILFVLKIFLANLLVWQSNCQICLFFMSTWKFKHIVAYATVWYNKTCITHKRDLRIDWKFENKLILNISIDLCYNNPC